MQDRGEVLLAGEVWPGPGALQEVLQSSGLPLLGRAQQPVPRWFVLTYMLRAYKKCFSPQGFHYWDELNSQYQGGSYWLTRSASVIRASTTGTSSTASTKVVRIDLQEVLQSSGLPQLGRAQQPVPRYFLLTYKLRASTTGTSSTASTKVVFIDLQAQGFHYWDELNSQYQGSFYWLTSSGLPLLGRAQQPVPRWLVLTYKKGFSSQGFHYWDELNSQYQGGSYRFTRSASVLRASTTGTSSTASTKVVRIDLQEGLQSPGLPLLGRAQQPVPRWLKLAYKEVSQSPGLPLLGWAQQPVPRWFILTYKEVSQSPGLPLLGRAQHPVPRWFVLTYKKCFSPQGFHYCDELNSRYQGGTYWLTRSWTSSTASTKVVRIDLQEVLQSPGLPLLGRAQQPVTRWFVLTYKKCFSPQGFHYWDELNSQYQLIRIDFLKCFSPQGFHYWDELNSQYQGGSYWLTRSFFFFSVYFNKQFYL